MKAKLCERLELELIARGYRRLGAGLDSPNDTMGIADSLLTTIEFGELVDMMITRREKVFRSVEAVGQEPAKASYDDVVLIIDALKSVLREFVE